jgi:hypothetical protein
MNDDKAASISPKDLYAGLGKGGAPFIIDVRHDPPFKIGEPMLAGAAMARAGQVRPVARRTARRSERSRSDGADVSRNRFIIAGQRLRQFIWRAH